MRRVGLWLINSGVDHWRQFVALLQCLPPPSARRGGNVQIRRASQRLDVIGAFSESFRPLIVRSEWTRRSLSA
jgi:hypothetical protein